MADTVIDAARRHW